MKDLLKAAKELSAELHKVGYAESFRYQAQLETLDAAIEKTQSTQATQS
jgi:hypothetical protein